ncbi:MAG: hypothetical protein KDC87_01840 [Planctomycetes bacterium]|nr:hypothetical protein [Planctomycetota bacterium]MCB9870336.1 hypothetical protein [Planctomycetota bacterium]MCB9888087.1 hypothetical protein [Planctomycetota bacterium]
MRILAVLLLVSATSAQSFFIPDNAPTGGSNVIPFGHSTTTSWENQKYQTMALAADINNAAVLQITDLAFPPSLSGLRHFDSIEIVMAQTSAATMSTTYAANLSANVQTVLSAKNYEWNQTANAWNRIGLDRPYLYIAAQGANIVLQITVSGARLATTSTAWPGHASATRPRLYAYNYTGAPPAAGTLSTSAAIKWEIVTDGNDLSLFGKGCQGTGGVVALTTTGSAKLGGSATIDLSGAPANALNALIVNISRLEPPLDLAIIGAPGCSMYLLDAIAVYGVASSTGSRSIPVTLPTSGQGFRAYVQYFVRDAAANNLGWTSSNYARFLLGN